MRKEEDKYIIAYQEHQIEKMDRHSKSQIFIRNLPYDATNEVLLFILL